MPEQDRTARRPDEWDLEFLPWMDGLHYTLGVYDWGVTKITEEEQLITRVLDEMLDKQLNHPAQIEKFVGKAKNSSSKLVSGRLQTKGESPLNAWSGTQHDRMLKHLVQGEVKSGQLSAIKSFRPNFGKGPDFIYPPLAAWDVTTMKDIGAHITRDSHQRGSQRYYILVWDDIKISTHKLHRHRSAQ